MKQSLINQNFVTEFCPHSDQSQIADWKCSICNSQVAQFDCMFDDYQGRTLQFLKILYENQFLQDFLHDQIDRDVQSPKNGAVSAGDKQNQNQQNQKRIPDIIYQQYQPNNIQELREYIFFCVSKDQQIAVNQSNQTRQDHIGQPQEPTATIENVQQAAQADTVTSIIGESLYNTATDNVDENIFGKSGNIFGSGKMRNLSKKLVKYLTDYQETQERIYQRYRKDVLLFDSIIESGNLLQADRITSEEYHMYMQVDTNTKGHQQWFNFRVRNTRKGRKYQFHIKNFTKPGVTGASGTRKSELTQRVIFKSKLGGSEWHSIGPDQLQFVKSRVQRRKKDVLAAGADSDQDEEAEEQFAQEAAMAQEGMSPDQKMAPLRAQSTIRKRKVFYYYSLVFDVEFQHDNDSVCFAFSHPYTYTQILKDIFEKEDQLRPVEGGRNLQSVIKEHETDHTKVAQEEIKNGPKPLMGLQFENKNQLIYYRRQELCRTVCGVPIWQITVTRDSYQIRKRPIILITSRVHSGETPASFVFKGMLDFLLSDKKEARLLRKLYTFVLIPCLNPDGVLCGNYRNSLAGVDLNRQWIQPDEDFQPEIYHVKNLLKRYTEIEKRQIWIYCDIHGHSKKKNSFFYGCNTAANGGFLSWTIVRLLPRIFAQKTHMFNFKDCRFKVEPYKIGTGRVVAWKQFQITHSFTLENSFFGYDFGDDSKEFSEECYNGIGRSFCDSVYEFHYVWKQIQRELNITNGWLKPRVLIEITGVPAAQLLLEELQRKKKEENKLLAIQQYKQFLQKFFGGSKRSIKSFQPKSLLNVIGVQDKAPDSDIHSGALKIRRQNLIQSLPVYSPAIEYVDDAVGQEIFNLEKCLIGLVKIQALVRGVILRKKRGIKIDFLKFKSKSRVVNLLSNTNESQLVIHNNGVDLRRKGKEDTIDLDAELLDSEDNSNPIESRDSLSNSGFGRLSSRRFELVNRDWRHYFQETELEKAFQIVEIEQRDISEEDSQSRGSNSDPSDDNLEKNEILQNVYCQNEEKAGKKLKEIRSLKNQFLNQIRNTSPITAAQLYSRLKNAPLENSSGSGVNAVRNQLTKGGAKIKSLNAPGSANQNSNQNVFQESPKKSSFRMNQSNFQSHNNIGKRGVQSPYQNVQAQSGVVSMSQVLNQNFDINFNQEPMSRVQSNLSQNQVENYYNSNEYHQSQRNMWKNGKSLQSAILQNRAQERAQTSYGIVSGLGGPIANSILVGVNGPAQPRLATNTLGQLKLIQLNQKHFGKRDNINQVIKDCFITRKCGLKQQQQKYNSKSLNKTAGEWQNPVKDAIIRREVTKSITTHSDLKQRELPQNYKQTVGNATKEQPNYRLDYPTNNYSVNNLVRKQRRAKRPKSPSFSQAKQSELNYSASYNIEQQVVIVNQYQQPVVPIKPPGTSAVKHREQMTQLRDQIRIQSGKIREQNAQAPNMMQNKRSLKF